MKKLILILFIVFSVYTQAQNSVSGRITDSHNTPLKGVSVHATEINKETISNENGEYIITDLPNKSVTLNFFYMGYKIQNKIIEKPQKLTILNITLEETIFEMDEVIVSTVFNKLQSQNIIKVDRETVNSMQKAGATTLIEGLATIPGVNQISTGTSIGKPVIRGLSGNRVVVYTQGIRLENQQFGGEHGLGLNESGIESVEVIKGPASLLYGSDAIGGVLFFNPEKFALSNKYEANFGERVFSNTLGSTTTLGFKTSTNNWKYLIRGTYNTHSDYEIPDGERVTNTRFNEADIKAGIGYSDSSFSTTLRYNYNNLDIGIPEEGISNQSTTKNTAFPSQRVINNIVSSNNIIYFTTSKLDIDLGYINNNRSEFEDSDEPSLQMVLNTLNYNIKYNLPNFGKFETILGFQGMFQDNNNLAEEFLIPDATTTDFGVFGTGIYNWGVNSLQGGIRFDYRKITAEENGTEGEEGYFEPLDTAYDSFNASLGYKTNFTDTFIMRLNLATGFRAPTLAELSSNGVHEGTLRYEIGNPNLVNEQNFQTDLDLDYRISHFEIGVSAFYNKINDYIYASPTDMEIEGYQVYNYLQNDAYLYGGEIVLHFHPHPLDWLHFDSSYETVTGKLQDGGYLPQIPANNWNNTLKADFDIKNWLNEGFASVNVSSTFSQEEVSEFDIPSSAYTLLNLSLGGEIHLGKTIFNLLLNGNNLLDKTYIPYLSRLASDGIPNMGRNFILGINFKI
ncbi:MAG TPA: TonB-dependent receptor [Flavobacterium sp.]|nr:TonB-dependent receptor [Flavobacterium sp.]